MTCLPPNLHSFEVSSHSHQNGSDIQLWVSNGFELELLKKLSCGTYYRHRCFLFESSWVTIWHQFRVYSTVIQLYVSFFRFFSLLGFYKISSIISCARLLNWSFSSHFSSVQVPLCCAQSCPPCWDRIDCSLPGSSVLGDSPVKNSGLGSHALLQGIFPT